MFQLQKKLPCIIQIQKSSNNTILALLHWWYTTIGWIELKKYITIDNIVINNNVFKQHSLNYYIPFTSLEFVCLSKHTNCYHHDHSLLHNTEEIIFTGDICKENDTNGITKSKLVFFYCLDNVDEQSNIVYLCIHGFLEKNVLLGTNDKNFILGDLKTSLDTIQYDPGTNNCCNPFTEVPPSPLNVTNMPQYIPHDQLDDSYGIYIPYLTSLLSIGQYANIPEFTFLYPEKAMDHLKYIIFNIYANNKTFLDQMRYISFFLCVFSKKWRHVIAFLECVIQQCIAIYIIPGEWEFLMSCIKQKFTLDTRYGYNPQLQDATQYALPQISTFPWKQRYNHLHTDIKNKTMFESKTCITLFGHDCEAFYKTLSLDYNRSPNFIECCTNHITYTLHEQNDINTLCNAAINRIYLFYGKQLDQEDILYPSNEQNIVFKMDILNGLNYITYLMKSKIICKTCNTSLCIHTPLIISNGFVYLTHYDIMKFMLQEYYFSYMKSVVAIEKSWGIYGTTEYFKHLIDHDARQLAQTAVTHNIDARTMLASKNSPSMNNTKRQIDILDSCLLSYRNVSKYPQLDNILSTLLGNIQSVSLHFKEPIKTILQVLIHEKELLLSFNSCEYLQRDTKTLYSLKGFQKISDSNFSLLNILPALPLCIKNILSRAYNKPLNTGKNKDLDTSDVIMNEDTMPYTHAHPTWKERNFLSSFFCCFDELNYTHLKDLSLSAFKEHQNVLRCMEIWRVIFSQDSDPNVKTSTITMELFYNGTYGKNILAMMYAHITKNKQGNAVHYSCKSVITNATNICPYGSQETICGQSCVTQLRDLGVDDSKLPEIIRDPRSYYSRASSLFDW